MMMNKKRVDDDFNIDIGGVAIKPTSHLKYLGVTFDDRKKFKKHIEEVSNKGIKTMSALSSLMTNGTRTSQAVRKLYYMTLEAIVLYGAPVWAQASTIQANYMILKKTQRLGLARVVSAYRTVPSETLCVLAGTTPWHLKIEERRQQFELENIIINKDNLNKMKTLTIEGKTLEEIHEILEGLKIEIEDLEEEDNSRKIIRKWIRKNMREVTDLIWQQEWNEGRVGRKRIGKSQTEECWYHQGAGDTPEHTLVECPRWKNEREAMRKEMGIREEETSLDRIMGESLVIKEEEAEERRREKEGLDDPVARDTQEDLESGDPERMDDL
ncbi:uncharacterized protein LOC143362892 [Halictus rubicundus]|uniref:uncharacterized protein LOC143362892 n=1 Tax=Halictus rubicundus TaxID=77578 RepID=UPI0040364BBC